MKTLWEFLVEGEGRVGCFLIAMLAGGREGGKFRLSRD